MEVGRKGERRGERERGAGQVERPDLKQVDVMAILSQAVVEPLPRSGVRAWAEARAINPVTE